MEKQGKYIYGIIVSNSENSFDRCWIMANERICAVTYRDIAAIISDSELIDYLHQRKDILARQLVKHQRIIEGIMPQYAIIPMKLGTFAQNETEVRDSLSKGYNLIKEIFERIADKIEIDVAASWSDLGSALKEAGEEREIKEFKERLLAEPKRITVDDQMKAGFIVKEALERKREVYSQEIQAVLKSVSHAFKTHELMDDKMVVNIAFLINKDKREDFDKRVEELNVKFNDKLNFRCVGPLPAYSFYMLEIKKLEFEEIDWAKKRLGILDNITSKDEIKRAFRTQAFSAHPDKNLNSLYAEKEFDEIERSYSILFEYAQACEQVGLGNLIFNEDEFKKNAVLVRVLK